MAGADRIAVEFNATQRVMEAQLGVTSLLVRPPYAYDGYFYLDSSPDLVRTIHDLGYVVGGIDVDGFDYLASAELIRERVVTQILEGEGQVILLHDSGGNRRATIAALPRIIDDLRSAGYRFVTTHELAGLSRAQVMPPERGQGLVAGAEAGIRRAAIRIGNSLAEIWPSIAIGTAALGVLRFALIVLAALTRRTPKRTRPSTGPSAIAVIVPAYNEEAVIATTVRSLLGSSISERLEILVVDDGSKDRTAEVVREAFGHDARVRLLCQANGGKAAALNHGIASTQSEIIVAIDSDTALMPDAIELLVTPFADPGVGAVAGKVVVGNRRNLITRFQALEYTVSQSLDRRAFERFNAIGVVPGAIGAWRRSALVQVGGYSHDTLAEDADLTLSLQRAGWRIVSESRAVALTEAPESLKAFVKQRFRWTFGTLQVAWKHKRALVERPSGVSLVTLPNIFLFQFGFTLLAPFMDGLLLTSIAQSSIVPVFASAATQDDNLAVLALYWALFQIVDLMAVAAGVALDGDKSCWRLVPLVLIQRFSYRQVMYWIALRALLAAVKGTLVGWGKLVRTGNVAAPATAGT
jgi:cellulose synthase/poly-beta-1,6-N-acetylglucosamine synthase-like glycosyltransferase